MNRIILSILTMLMFIPNISAWEPTAVQGREWVYEMHHYSFTNPATIYASLKVGGPVTIDGIEYMSVYSYSDGVLDSDEPYCFIRDTEDGKLHVLLNDEDRSIKRNITTVVYSNVEYFDELEYYNPDICIDRTRFLAFDLEDPYNTQSFTSIKWHSDECGDFIYQAPNGRLLNGKLLYDINHEHIDTYMGRSVWMVLVEGLGFIRESYYGNILIGEPLISVYPNSSSYCYIMLQKIIDSDGTILYTRENMIVNGITDTDNDIVDDSPTFYNLHGIPVNENSSGILIERRGNTVRKIIKK